MSCCMKLFIQKMKMKTRKLLQQKLLLINSRLSDLQLFFQNDLTQFFPNLFLNLFILELQRDTFSRISFKNNSYLCYKMIRSPVFLSEPIHTWITMRFILHNSKLTYTICYVISLQFGILMHSYLIILNNIW